MYWRASAQAEDLTRAANLVTRYYYYYYHHYYYYHYYHYHYQVLPGWPGLCAGGGGGRHMGLSRIF